MPDGNVPCLLNIPLFSKDDCNASSALADMGSHSQACPNASVAFSVGLHPWNVDEEEWEEKVEQVRQKAALPRVWAIGECGLDKLCGASFDLQMKAFRAQIAIAEEARKPMVIHCVKAFSELMALRKETEADSVRRKRRPMPWVIHGFRGKPDLAKQIMAKGLLLSFGHSYNTETLCQVFNFGRPFFLETDDCHLPICQIYEQVARSLGVDVARLDALCDPRHTVFSGFPLCDCLRR